MTEFLSKDRDEALNDVLDDLYERLKAYKTELSLQSPEWYNPHDFASGHWKGRVGVLTREKAWVESLIDRIERS